MERWSQRGFFLQHFFQMVSLSEIAIYEGEGDVALKSIAQGAGFADSGLLRAQTMRIEWHFLRGRAQLSAWSGDSSAEHLAAAEQNVRALEGEDAEWASGLAKLLRAGIAHARGSRDAANLLRGAIAACDQSGLRMHALAGRVALARFHESADDLASAESAVAAMRLERVANPARFVRLFLPTLAAREDNGSRSLPPRERAHDGGE
jgi:hypothetical protein